MDNDLIGDIREERRLINDGRFALKYGSFFDGPCSIMVELASEKRDFSEDVELLADIVLRWYFACSTRCLGEKA